MTRDNLFEGDHGHPTPALSHQEGGDHYKGWTIQPVEFLQVNSDRLDWCSSNIIKYACRWRAKGGKRDLLKIKHYVDLLLELEVPATLEGGERK